jgi:hypothetical protein
MSAQAPRPKPGPGQGEDRPARKSRFQTVASPSAPTAEAVVQPAPQAPAAAPAQPAPAAAEAAPRARHATAEPKAPAWDARMSLTLSKEMKRALDIARAEDGIEGTARIRAMIALWESDERLRKRIDREARTYR